MLDGRVDEVVRLLAGAAQQDGAAHLLLCRAYYAEEWSERAVEECETALVTLAQDSQAQDWMGRAYGLRARTAGTFSAIKLARRVKGAFEAAYHLDPLNAAAANDLGEYYVGAPAIVGGGLDLAGSLSEQIAASLPEAGHRLRGMIAEKRRDFPAAEREFRAATAVASRPEAWVDLGAFYFRRSDWQQAAAALERAVALDWRHGAPTVDAATLLEENHWGVERPVRWLHLYLDGAGKSDAAPAFRVRTLLGEMLLRSGDAQGAKIEINKALVLAHDYAPARRALEGL